MWPDDIFDKNSKIRILRFTRVLFGLTCGPFLLNGTVAYHLQNYVSNGGDEQVLAKLLRDLYVDDCTVSVDDEMQGMNFFEKAKMYFAEGGFNLRKWMTNNRTLQKFIDSSEKVVIDDFVEQENVSYAKEELGIHDKYKKVLGVSWDLNTDELIFEMEQLASNGLKLSYTKRNILKISASFYDPMGLICPVVLQPKILFQQLCALKIGWDEVVDGDLCMKWESFLIDLKELQSLKVNRFISRNIFNQNLNYELHGFCDSSEVA